METDDRQNLSLLAWQWSIYTRGHADRANLAIHLATWPFFVSGLIAIVTAIPLLDPWLALGGVVSSIAAMVLQGRGHAREEVAPPPFRGPLDVALRIFAEQLITFPRYVLSGSFARAWAAAR